LCGQLFAAFNAVRAVWLTLAVADIFKAMTVVSDGFEAAIRHNEIE
jgi:hypothetical protein